MATFKTNMNPEAVNAQILEGNKEKTYSTTFDVKNYLNVRLDGNEQKKKLTIRLLPSSPESPTPFEKVYMHTIRVNKDVSASGWKTFVCPTHNHMGTSCPFCDVSEQAKRAKNSTNNESEKENYKNVESMNRVREMWIARCIERGHEEDGVKFWLIANSKDSPYAKIMSVWQNRWDKAKENGEINDIFDLNTGRDIDVTITKQKDGKNTFSIDVDDKSKPLTEDYELGMSWINDQKKWTDVYKVKPIEYMEVIVNGGVPMYSKDKGIYVDSEELKEEAKRIVESNITAKPVDYAHNIVPQTATVSVPTASDDAITNVDDLPF